MDQNARATKGDLSVAIDQFRSEMNHGYNDIVERIDESKTEMLKAFYAFAAGNNKRMAELEGNDGAFRSRLTTIEDRLLEVGKRPNMPLQAA
jgi:hypothetical protein